MVAKRKPKPKDDGVPYEKMESFRIREFDQWEAMSMGDRQSRLQYFAPSPFQVVFLRQLIDRLFEISGEDGTRFLKLLGIDSIEELGELDEMSGPSIIEMLAAAITSLPPDLIAEFRDELGA